VEKRVEELLNQMTLEEKVGMLAGTDNWHTRSIERLGIPAIKVTDGPHGTRTMSDDDPNYTLPGTCYPTGVGLAATWNTELIGRVGRAIGEEARDKGCAIVLGPCVNIQRSPLGGRNFESYSEDPYLCARLAVAFIKGAQSRKTGTSIKHFALNNSEFERFTISSEVGERAIREIYLPAFRAAVVEAQPWTVMCSYNRINGTYASENKLFLTDILKKEWGLEGFVVSDWGAVHSTVEAANAGLDLEMPGPARFFGDELVAAVKRGEVSEEVIDDKVRRILRVIEKSGAFEKPRKPSKKSSDTPERQRLAREAAGEAIVLLKNKGNILPLRKGAVRSIAVIGPNATEARIEGSGSSRVTPYYAVSPLDGLREQCGVSIKINYEPGCRNNRFTPVLNIENLVPGTGRGEHGLKGEYFNNNDLEGEPVLTRVDKEFALRWGGILERASPGPGVDKDNFSIRWTGMFLAPATGKYRFGLLTDGLGRIYIGGKLIVGKWTGETPMAELMLHGERIGEYRMEAGKSYPIKVEYCKNPAREWPLRRIRLGCEVPLPGNAMARAADIAGKSDVAVVFVGLSEEWESEGFDRENMELPGEQAELIKKVARANKNTIVVLNNGSPVSIEGWIDRVAGVVEAWFSGQECGNAIADVLLGKVNPSGKLPETFPRRIEDNPAYINYPGESGKVLYGEGIFVGYRYYDAKKVEPLFPFGYGLSYTIFEYSNLRMSTTELKAGKKLKVSIDIRNTGEREGKEVVQLYVWDVASSLIRPPKELKGFQKINLKPGETKTVEFTLGEEELSFYDPERKQWVAEPGEFEIMLGSSSRDIRARALFQLV
jgi:beta-glucosidase